MRQSQGLKPRLCRWLYGTAEAVPFHKTLANGTVKAAPFHREFAKEEQR
jgi:hypothetical protein